MHLCILRFWFFIGSSIGFCHEKTAPFWHILGQFGGSLFLLGFEFFRQEKIIHLLGGRTVNRFKRISINVQRGADLRMA